MSAPFNPYAAPVAVVDDVSDAADQEAEKIRKEHIKHEASLKAVGLLYYLGGFGLLAVSLSVFYPALYDAQPKIGTSQSVLMTLFFVAFTAVMIVVARGLRTLKPWVRIPTALLSVLGMLNLGFSTLINAYILWLVLSKKGRFILSKDYAAIVAATPQVKYRTSTWVWVALGLILLLFVVAIVYPMVSR